MNLDSRWVAASSLLLALCLSIFACGKAVPNTGTDSATHNSNTVQLARR